MRSDEQAGKKRKKRDKDVMKKVVGKSKNSSELYLLEMGKRVRGVRSSASIEVPTDIVTIISSGGGWRFHP